MGTIVLILGVISIVLPDYMHVCKTAQRGSVS